MQDGACVGMPLSEAKSLLRHSGDFHIFEHDLDADLAAIESLADSLDTFSPVVGMETVDPEDFRRGRRPDSLLLEVTGLAHLFGDEDQLARQLLVHCETLGYLPRIAIADTIGVAWGMARYFSGRYFAQHQQPLVLSPGPAPAPAGISIQQLPVESLRLQPSIVDTLYQLGIETVGQLQQLSREDLAMRFGNAIHRRLDQMTGVLEEPIIARRKPAEFNAEQLLEYPTSHRDTIEVIIARLIGELCEQMRSRQRGALQWTVRLVCQSGAPLEFCVNLFQPTAQTKQVMPLVEMQLEQALSPHTRRARKKGLKSRAGIHQPSPNGNQFNRYTTIQVQEISISVTSDVLLAQQQRQLFDENPRLDRQSLAHLINRLASRLGTMNVVYPSLLSGAQPEYSFRLRPLVNPTQKHRRRKTNPSRQSHALARPFRLIHPPVQLEVCNLHQSTQVSSFPGESSGERLAESEQNLQGFSSSGAPALLRITPDTQPQKIIASWGPERIETGWWRGLTVCRDYWRIEVETHQHFWVYRDLRNGGWFLHGEF